MNINSITLDGKTNTAFTVFKDMCFYAAKRGSQKVELIDLLIGIAGQFHGPAGIILRETINQIDDPLAKHSAIKYLEKIAFEHKAEPKETTSLELHPVISGVILASEEKKKNGTLCSLDLLLAIADNLPIERFGINPEKLKASINKYQEWQKLRFR